jgi:hypothetical protein
MKEKNANRPNTLLKDFFFVKRTISPFVKLKLIIEHTFIITSIKQTHAHTQCMLTDLNIKMKLRRKKYIEFTSVK